LINIDNADGIKGKIEKQKVRPPPKALKLQLSLLIIL
jgi:hypothetical protein